MHDDDGAPVLAGAVRIADQDDGAPARSVGGAAPEGSELRRLAQQIAQCDDLIALRAQIRLARREIFGHGGRQGEDFAAVLAGVAAALAAIDLNRLDDVTNAIVERDAAILGGARLQ